MSQALIDSSSTARVYAEVCCLQRCRHPNTLSLEECFVSATADVYTVTRVFETDLRKRLKSGGGLLPTERLWITLQLLRALAYLHGARICHGDVKPANVLLRRSSEGFDACLADFGHVQPILREFSPRSGDHTTAPTLW